MVGDTCFCVLEVRKTGNKDDLGRKVMLIHIFGEIQTAFYGHADVRENDGRYLLLKGM